MPAKWVHRFESKPGRWVFNPSTEARAEGAEIKVAVEKHWKAPRYYYHLRRGGHVAALRQHQKSSLFIKLDLSDFFGSISRSRLSRALKNFFSHTEARHMATASTVRHPTNPDKTCVPYGFVQSPLVASLVLHKSSLGAFLDSLSKDRSLVVSVYVDDIIISSADLTRLNTVRDALIARVAKSGFLLNDAKSEGPAAAIVAFNIGIAAGRELAIVERRLLELKTRIESSGSVYEMEGILGYVRSVNLDQAAAIGTPSTSEGTTSV